jgi:hypothetical protein
MSAAFYLAVNDLWPMTEQSCYCFMCQSVTTLLCAMAMFISEIWAAGHGLGSFTSSQQGLLSLKVSCCMHIIEKSTLCIYVYV